MSEVKSENPERRGRPKHSAVDRFQTMAWFNSIARVLEIESPYSLECVIQRENIVERDGKIITSRAWDKYKVGTRVPQDGHMKSGKHGAVLAAEHHVPESGYVFRHPIWKVMRARTMGFDEATRLISALKPSVAGYYMDLSKAMANNRTDSLSRNIGLPIWIERGDYYHALDHLAANLIFLRLDIIRHLEGQRRDCAENVAKTLGPVAQSPWIWPFHEEMYDWLEANVWGNLFDELYTPRQENNASGWRRTKPDWLTAYSNEIRQS
jgi:hypothetical protein